MEVLNAAGVTPLTSLPKPKKLLPFKPTKSSHTNSTHKLNLAAFISKSFNGGIAMLSSVLGASAAAKALTYEEALQQTAEGSPSFDGSLGFDVGELVDGLVRFGSENPLVVGGGALALAVPLILSQILSKPKSWGVQSAKIAYAGLSEDVGAQLLDVREASEVKASGIPDLKSLKKKAVSITFDRDNKEGFLKKLSLRFKDPENTTLYILDKFDGNSEFVAQLVTANGFKYAYAVKDGADGPRGWKNSGLPWTEPKKASALDLGDLKTAISEIFGEASDGLPVTLGLAAATGLGVLAFSEIETVLQLLGSAAIFQFATKKLLFAEDRKVTFKQIDEFLTTKVAPKELVDEITTIGKALLPVSTSPRASLPAPVEEKQVTAPETDTVPETKVEAVAEPPKAINSVPQEDIKAESPSESPSKSPRPLSPYPYYPDFKPPTSPTPSQP